MFEMYYPAFMLYFGLTLGWGLGVSKEDKLTTKQQMEIISVSLLSGILWPLWVVYLSYSLLKKVIKGE